MECKKYKFDELSIGMTASFIVSITKEKQELFLELSGDINPLHTDSDYARKEGYKDCVVYGMCTASFYSTLVGVYLPGEKCIFHECNIQWSSPVYVGDVLTVNGKITKKDERFQRVTIMADIRNQDGKKVSRAILVAGVR